MKVIDLGVTCSVSNILPGEVFCDTDGSNRKTYWIKLDKSNFITEVSYEHQHMAVNLESGILCRYLPGQRVKKVTSELHIK